MSAQTAHKALDVLEVIAAHPGLSSVSQVSERCGFPRPTTARLLAALEARSYIARVNGKFQLGAKALTLASSYLDGSLLRHAAQPALRSLNAATNETIHLAVPDGLGIVYIAKVESEHSVRMRSTVGERGQYHSTALGKAMLAVQPESALDDLMVRILPLRPRTANTTTDEMELRRELRQIRRQGYAIDDMENEEDVRCVAAAVVAPSNNNLYGAISVSGPAYRMPLQRIENEIASLLKTEVLKLNQQLDSSSST